MDKRLACVRKGFRSGSGNANANGCGVRELEREQDRTREVARFCPHPACEAAAECVLAIKARQMSICGVQVKLEGW